MTTSEADLALIDAVYGIATGENTLTDTIRAFLVLQNDPIAAMFYLDSIVDDVGDSHVISQQPAYAIRAQALFDEHRAIPDAPKNPFLSRATDDLIAGKIVLSDDLLSFDKLMEDDYYKLVLEPLAIRRAMGWVVAGRGQRWLTMGTGRTAQEGEYTRQHVERASLFKRHLSRAIHLQELLDSGRGHSDLLEQSFQHVPYGILLLDDERRILFSNLKAAQLIVDCAELRATNEHFETGSTPHEKDRFHSWWKLLVGSASEDGASYPLEGPSLIREIEASRFSSDSSQGVVRRRWMLTLKEQPEARELSISSVQHRFGLTRSEAHVCIHLCRNGDAVSTATAMGLSPNTVRTHLKSAFSKTGTRNQVELVIKLMA